MIDMSWQTYEKWVTDYVSFWNVGEEDIVH
jgi:hypothetical protein